MNGIILLTPETESTERLFVNGDFFSTTASSSRNYNEEEFILGSAANNGEGSDGYYQDLRIYKGVAKYTSNFTVPVAGAGGVNSFYLKFADTQQRCAWNGQQRAKQYLDG